MQKNSCLNPTLSLEGGIVLIGWLAASGQVFMCFVRNLRNNHFCLCVWPGGSVTGETTRTFML